jgi:enoyl-CoA hydratase/carnithine racemase
MPYEFVLTERDGPVGIVRINRPQVRNALNPQTMAELVDALEPSDDKREGMRAFLEKRPGRFTGR